MRSQSYNLFPLALAASAAAQYIDSLSFGHNDRISPNGRGLPGWSVTSQNHQPQLLSDRVVLTPPVPGNARGALWADNAVPNDHWTADFDFRASGQDSGSGNLQVWLTKNKDQVAQNSIYTVEQFDGLAIVIDQYGHGGGSIRGFLNDGTQNYKAHSSLESLAFGHCEYSYRNLGRPSRLRITSANGLSVTIDDRPCFSTERVGLPSGYHFGITAATAENPDSFEIYKFAVSTPSTSSTGPPIQNQRAADERLNKLPGSPEALPDTSADSLTSSTEQFADLHNRLQGLTHQIADMYALFDIIGRKIDERHSEIAASVVQQGVPRDVLDRMDRRIEGIERTVDRVLQDVESKDYRQHLGQLQASIEGVRGGLAEGLPDSLHKVVSASAPRLGLFVGIVVAVQIFLAAVYVLYKRRRANAPKKYL